MTVPADAATSVLLHEQLLEVLDTLTELGTQKVLKITFWSGGRQTADAGRSR